MRDFIKMDLVSTIRGGSIVREISFGIYSVNINKSGTYIWPLGRAGISLNLKKNTVNSEGRPHFEKN